MNTVGIRYEQRSGTRVLSRLHGGYSLGVLAGGASGALAAHFGVSVGSQFGVTAALLGVTALVVANALPADTAGREAPTTPPARRRRGLRLPLPVAALAVAALLMEGMIFDWSALLVARDYGGGTSLGAFTIAAFSCAMFLSRSMGDALVARVGLDRLVVVGSVGFAVAMLIGLSQPSPAGVLIAITITSLALGPLFPMAVSAAGRGAPADAAAMTAMVSAVGYLAYLGGPPIVGMGAELISLPATVALVTIACATAIAYGGRKVRAPHVRDDEAAHIGGGTRTW
jgi:predicted MFS family arabinose efflux permease